MDIEQQTSMQNPALSTEINESASPESLNTEEASKSKQENANATPMQPTNVQSQSSVLTRLQSLREGFGGLFGKRKEKELKLATNAKTETAAAIAADVHEEEMETTEKNRNNASDTINQPKIGASEEHEENKTDNSEEANPTIATTSQSIIDEQITDGQGNSALDENDPEAKRHEYGSRKTAEKIDARPEPKPRKRLRRGSSTVAPMPTMAGDDDGDQRRQQTINNTDDKANIQTRPLSTVNSLWPIHANHPSQWIYVQMPDRTFKRIAEGELQRTRPNEEKPTATSAAATAEFMPMEYTCAHRLQSSLHAIALIVQGFLSGLAFGHAVFAFALVSNNNHDSNCNNNSELPSVLMDSYAHFAVAIQTIFYVGLNISLVDILDRFLHSRTSGIRSNCCLSFHLVAILCWLCALIASISSSQVDEYLANHNLQQIYPKNTDDDDESRSAHQQQCHHPSSLLIVWQWLSAVRAFCCIFGWLLSAPSRHNNSENSAMVQQFIGDNKNNAALKKAEF